MDCFDKIKLGKLSEEFAAKVKEGMSDHEKRLIGTELALKYHKQLHAELSALKKATGSKPTKYTEPERGVEEPEVQAEAQPEPPKEEKKPEPIKVEQGDMVSAAFAGGRIKGEIIRRGKGTVTIEAKDGTKYTVPEDKVMRPGETVFDKYAKMVDHDVNVNGNKENVHQYIEKADAVLRGLFPDHRLEVHETEKDYLEHGGLEGSAGLYVPKEKAIKLNLERIADAKAENTVFHEVIHPIVREALESRSGGIEEAYNQLHEMKDEEGMSEVWSHEKYYDRPYDKKVEAITEFLSLVADGKIDATKLKYDTATKIIDVINKILKAIGIDKQISTPGDLRKLAEGIKRSFEAADAKHIKEVLGGRKEVEAGKEAASIKDVRDNAEELIKKYPEKSREDLVNSFKKYLPEDKINKIIDKVRGEEKTGETKSEEPPKKPPTEKKDTEGENEDLTSIRLADTAETREEFNLPTYDKRAKTVDEIVAEADTELKNGYDVNELVGKLKTGEYIPKDFEQVILTKQKIHLDNELRKNPSKENLKKYNDFVDATDMNAGSEAGRSLFARSIKFGSEDSLGDFMREEEKSLGVDTLTEKQMKDTADEFNTIQDLKAKLEVEIEKNRKLEADNKAKQTVDRLKKSSPKTKKSHEEYKKERADIVQSMRDKLKKIRGEGQSTILPYARELFEIAPDVSKYVTSLISEGVDNLGDIITRVHDDLKGDIEGLKKEDVRDLIAGVYNKPKESRNELMEKKRDIQTEAKLVKQLEDIQNNVDKSGEPKVEKKEIKNNKRVAELRSQIKDLTGKPPEEKIEQGYVKRMQAEIERINKQLESGDFSKPEKNQIKLSKEARAIKDKLIEARSQRQIRILKQEYSGHSFWQKAGHLAQQVINVPKAALTTLDLSAMLRQGVIPTISRPKIAKAASAEMFKSVFSDKNYHIWFSELRESPRYDIMKESKLAIAEMDNPKLTAREDSYIGAGLVERIPFVGAPVKASERAYTMYLNKMRVDLFNMFADKFEANGKTYKNNKKLYDAMSKYVGNITGRGDLGKLEKWAPVLNASFFSPKLIAARIAMLNPVYFAKLPMELKKAYARDMGSFVATSATVLAAFKAYGATQDDDDPEKITVEVDPRSADFLKIKQGRTRFDILGGFQQYLRAGTQMVTKNRKSTETGEVYEIGKEDEQIRPRAKIAWDFLRNKFSPVLSMGIDAYTGKSAVGEKVTPMGELNNALVPMIYTSIKEAYEEGGTKRAIQVGLTNIPGISSSTYKEREPKFEKIKIYNTENKTSRDATQEEYTKYDDLKNKYFQEELNNLGKEGVFKDEYNEITMSEGKAAKTIPPDQLTPEEVKKLRTRIMSKASNKAKKELFEKGDESTTKQ